MSERSQVFELLNLDDGTANVEGLVAYALYKRHKREWCEEFEAEHDRQPNATEKLQFAKSVSTVTQLERYRLDAQNALIDFSDSLIDDITPEIQAEAVTGRIEAAASKVEKAGSFVSLVFSGTVSTLISTSVLTLLVVATTLFGVDVLDGLDALARDGGSEETSE